MTTSDFAYASMMFHQVIPAVPIKQRNVTTYFITPAPSPVKELSPYGPLPGSALELYAFFFTSTVDESARR